MSKAAATGLADALAEAAAKANTTLTIERTLNFVGAVLPWQPPIDKIAALMLLSRHSRRPVESIDFATKNDYPDKFFEELAAGNIYPIDIGKRKYHRARMPSATAWLAQFYLLNLSQGEKEVVRLVNENNRTGFLKGYRYAVPHLLRELYELDPANEAWTIEIISAAMDVVNAFIDREDGMVIRTTEPMDETLTRLAGKLRQDADKPFTLGHYLNDLWLLGCKPEGIQAKIKFWRDGLQKLEGERARANAEFAAMTHRNEFTVDGMKGVVLYTDDHFLAKSAARKGNYFVRLVIAKKDGHAAISTNRLSVQRLGAALNRIEPGRWHVNEQMGAVINGGPQYKDVPPTKIQALLVGLIQQHLVRNEKTK